jgi:hypothetical protein
MPDRVMSVKTAAKHPAYSLGVTVDL